MGNVFRSVIGENKLDLFISAMFQNSLDDKKFVCFKIEEIEICPPKTGAYNVFDRTANHDCILLKR